MDWDRIDREIAPLCREERRPGIGSRFVIGLLLLNTFAASPTKRLQALDLRTSPTLSLQHEFSNECWPLPHWRKRLGDELELLLADSLRVGAGSGALRIQDLKRGTVDITVQPKAISLPTDARLLHAAILWRWWRAVTLRLSSSSGISGSCASCAAGPAGSLSAPRSKVSRLWRRGLHFPLDGPGTACSSSATANGSSIPSMPRRWIASARPPRLRARREGLDRQRYRGHAAKNPVASSSPARGAASSIH